MLKKFNPPSAQVSEVDAMFFFQHVFFCDPPPPIPPIALIREQMIVKEVKIGHEKKEQMLIVARCLHKKKMS